MGLYDKGRRQKKPQDRGKRKQGALSMKKGVVAGALILASLILTSEAVGNTIKWLWETIYSSDKPTRTHTARTLPKDNPWTPPSAQGQKAPRYQFVKGKPIRECLKPGNNIDKEVVSKCWKDHLEPVD